MVLLRTLVVVVVVVLAGGAARADEGEVAIAPYVQPELAWVSHPLTKQVAPFDASSSVTLLPRLGVGGRYGVSNAFTVGVGVDGSAMAGLVAKGVTIENTVGDVATGTRVDLMLPISLAWRLETGSELSGVVEVSAGPQLVGWLANKALNPDLPGENGLPTELPIVVEDAWLPGAFGRVAVLFNGRFFNWLVVDAGAVATVGYAETASVHLGLLLRPSFVVPLRPI